MNPATRRTVSSVCLVFAILWFVLIVLFESRYLVSVLRHQQTLRDVLGTIYEEQIEGINFVLVLIYLIPGVFAWFMYQRFKKEY
jgi:Na+/H+ antiporter NhaC